MNKKQSKKIRRKANELAIEFILDRVLSREEADKYTNKELLQALPYEAYFRKGFTTYLGIGCYKWIEKQVKKKYNITYDELLEVGGLK